MIKCKLEVWGTTVVFQILEMDETQRSDIKSTEILSFRASNGFKVTSHQYPDIDDDTIYLRGTCSENDMEVVTIPFDTIADAEGRASKAIKAISEWVDNGGFNERKSKSIGRRKLKNKEPYWFINGWSDVSEEYWMDSCDDDARRWSLGNVYNSKEQAEAFVKRQKAIVRVNDAIDKLNEGWILDWNNECDGKYYVILYNNYKGEFDYDFSHKQYRYIFTINLCKSRKVVEQIIQDCESDLKLIFNIMD